MSDDNKNTISTYLGPDFQQKLIWQILVEPDFAKNVLPNIAVEYFDDPYLKRLFIIMLEYYREHDKVPNLQNGSIDDAIYKYKSPTSEVEGEVLRGKLDQIKLWNERVINKNQLYDGDVVRKEAINFIKQQEYRKLAEYITSKTKSGEIKTTAFNFEVEEKINKIYHIGDEEDYGTDVIDDIDNALSEDFRETIPTGIEVIDAVTGNGLGKGEIGLILAPSGIGKTTVLTKIANTAFNDGKRVLQIVFEDTIKQIQRKHFAIWSDIKLSEMSENRQIVKERTLSHAKKTKEIGGKLDIVKFSQEDTTLFDIRNWISRQEKKFGYKYDMIVLDYLDCLEPNRREKELLSAELSIIKSFEAMAGDYNIPCWSAIQTNRSGFNTEFVEAHNTGGNIKRVQKSHFVMSIAKPDKSDNINLANIKILKARFAQDGHEFKECIFNNDSLEIRITDKKYLSGLKTKKYTDEDLEKSERKAEKLNEERSGLAHSRISETVFDEGPTIGEIGNLRLKDGVIENKDFENEKKTEENKTEEKNDTVSDTVNDTVSDGVNEISPPPIEENETEIDQLQFKPSGVSLAEFNDTNDPSQQEMPVESGESIGGSFDPEMFLKECASDMDIGGYKRPDYLKKYDDEQGEILKE